MSTDRGHVPPLALGRYRTLKRAERGAHDAACELARLGFPTLSDAAREGAGKLHEAAHELRVILDDARGR